MSNHSIAFLEQTEAFVAKSEISLENLPSDLSSSQTAILQLASRFSHGVPRPGFMSHGRVRRFGHSLNQAPIMQHWISLYASSATNSTRGEGEAPMDGSETTERATSHLSLLSSALSLQSPSISSGSSPRVADRDLAVHDSGRVTSGAFANHQIPSHHQKELDDEKSNTQGKAPASNLLETHQHPSELSRMFKQEWPIVGPSANNPDHAQVAIICVASFRLSNPIDFSSLGSHELIQVPINAQYTELVEIIHHAFFSSMDNLGGDNISLEARAEAISEGATDLKMMCVEWRGRGARGLVTSVHKGNVSALLDLMRRRAGEEVLAVEFGV